MMLSASLLSLYCMLLPLFCYCQKLRFHRSNLTVVLARFKEDMHEQLWLPYHNISHIIYNRGESIPESYGYKVIEELENVGRESFIYLRYIVENYDVLSDLTVFTQAHPPGQTTQKKFAEVIIQLHHGTVRLRPKCDGFSWLFDYTIPVSDERMKEMYSVVQTNPYKTLMNFNLKEGSLAPVQRPMYSPCGSFIVTRAVIRRNPLSYYMRIVKSPLLNTLNDPPLGHILEWAWNDVFHSKCATDEKFICYGLTRTRTSAWLRGWWN